MAEEKDLNLVDVIRQLWNHKKLICIVCACCFAFAVFLAIFSPRVFKAECVFVPQTNQSFTSRYSSIASIIGMDLDMSGNDAAVSPKVYPYILENPHYLRDLMYTKIHVESCKEPITVYDYFTNEDYQKFNLITTIRKYTIGLPGLVLGKMFPDHQYDDDVMTFNSNRVDTLPALTKKEDNIARLLSRSVDIDVDTKQGLLTISAKMPEALAAAEVCEAAYDLLKKYVDDFKLAKSKKNLAFLEKQYAEAKEDYNRKQHQFAYYCDTHKGVMTATAMVERARLDNEAELSKTLYAELAKNVLSSRVKLEENNVTFTEIAPISVPIRKFKPSGTLLAIVWLFLGFAGSSIYIWTKESAAGKKK